MRSFLSLMAVGFLFVSCWASAEEPVVKKIEAIKKSDELEVAKTGEDPVVESVVAEQDTGAATSEPNMLIRLKSGLALPRDNGDISRFIPVTLDWEYLPPGNFGFGVSVSGMSGSNPVSNPTAGRPAGYELHKSLALVLATADYRFSQGSTRVSTGLRMGAVFYRDSVTPPAGQTATGSEAGGSQTEFGLGPSVNVDIPVYNSLFATVGGDYLFAKSSFQFGSFFAGLGADF